MFHYYEPMDLGEYTQIPYYYQPRIICSLLIYISFCTLLALQIKDRILKDFMEIEFVFTHISDHLLNWLFVLEIEF